MVPCKRNRVPLKEVLKLSLVPRRRPLPKLCNVATNSDQMEKHFSEVISVKDTAHDRSISEFVQKFLTDQTGSENVLDTTSTVSEGATEVNCIGKQKINKKTFFQSWSEKESKQEGPHTRGKYQQSKPNTRNRCRWDRLRKSSNLTPRITCCVYTDLVHCSVKPTGNICSRPCEMGLGSAPPKATGKTLSDPKPGADTSSGTRCKLNQGVINCETFAGRVSKRCRDKIKEGQSQVKARCIVCDLQPTAAKRRQVLTETPSVSTRLSNTDKSPTGLAGSEGALRRAVQGSRCALSGDCRYSFPKRKTLGKRGQKQSVVGLKIKTANSESKSSQKIVIWIDKYAKLTLCDIAHYCDACSHSCGYILPDVLKTKVAHCFKQDMRAGFRFRPTCLEHNKGKSKEGSLDENSEMCARVHSEKSVCQSQSLLEDQRTMRDCTDAETLTSRTTCNFLKGWPSETSAACSKLFLLGQCTKKGECRTSMWDRDAEDNLGPECDLTGVEICRDKRIKLGDNINDMSLPSTLDLENMSCNGTPKTACSDKGKTWMSDGSQSCLQLVSNSCSTIGLNATECVHKKSCGQIVDARNTDAGQMSPELLSQKIKVETDELESFTCQRVRPYFRKIKFSCARAYMPWPFSNSSVNRTCLAQPRDNYDSPINQNQSCSLSCLSNDMLPNAPRDPSSDSAGKVSHQSEENQEEDGESILAKRNRKRNGNMSSCSSHSKNMKAEESAASVLSVTAGLLTPRQRRRESDSVSASSTPANEPQADSSMSTPSPSSLCKNNWETTSTLSPTSSPFTHDGLSSFSVTPSSRTPLLFLLNKVSGVDLADAHSTGTPPMSSPPKCIVQAVEEPLFHSEETLMTPCSSLSTSSPAPPHSLGSFHSCESSLLLPQEEQESDEERSPPKLEPYYDTNLFNCDHTVVFGKECSSPHNIPKEQCVEPNSNDFMLLPLLSPVTSPRGHSLIGSLPKSQGCSDEEQINKDLSKHKILPGQDMSQIGNDSRQNCEEYLLDHQQCGGHCNEEVKGISSKCKTLSSPTSVGDVNDDNEEESHDCGDDGEQGKGSTVPLHDEIKLALTSGALTASCSPPGSDEVDDRAVIEEERPHLAREEESSPSETAGSERDEAKAEAACDSEPDILDEFTAYEHDVLLIDVTQDDPELFENLPKKSLLKLGPMRVSEAPKTRPAGVKQMLLPRIDGASLKFERRLTPTYSPDITEESNSRPWRPQSRSITFKTQDNTWPAADKQTRNMAQPDPNNSQVSRSLERSQPVLTVNSVHNTPPLMTIGNANMAEFRRQKFNYCKNYFSESLSCGFKMCRFQHVPLEGDEKFCIETVIRFSKNLMCLQKAGAVFTGYYQNNPPGVYFSMPVLLSLLWALLKASMLPDVFSVLSVSLTHKLVPNHEFLLALFNFVREKGLMGFVPELLRLTFKIASAGLELNLDCLDCVKNTPEFQQIVRPAASVSVSVNHKLSTSAPCPEFLYLVHSIVELELCAKQEDWRRMGEVFRSICQFKQHPNQVERISGRIAIALLCESRDKLSLPFATFAETVCQNEAEDSMIRSFLGRIGVSLMLRYHKTHQWAKGRRVVEVLSSKVTYSTLKGLFGNEDRASRCYLVTVATELFLLSGSVEGALNTLRENKWFLCSSSWPCEPADLESRSCVLMHLSEKTSHRDTLEVLCNLPGIKEPNNLIDVSRYSPLFNSHLQVCVDKQILLVASKTVEIMLSKHLSVDHALLQTLLQKMGKQNHWLHAREVFRYSLNMGYYPGISAPSGSMALVVPCRLEEVELALTFEMFITVNAMAILQLSETTTSCLSITLKRTQSSESEYLSAGSRLLAAASIPQPKLTVHYTAANSLQDQTFTLDIPSARRWLRYNHSWASETWKL